MKYITIKLTEDQVATIIIALGNNMVDYEEDYGGEDKLAVKNNRYAKKENAYLQRLINKLALSQDQ